MFYKNNYEAIKAFLIDKKLLQQNEELIVYLKQYPDDSCWEILRLLETLDKNNLLNKKSLQRCIAITQIKYKEYSWSSEKLYDSRIFQLLRTLDNYSIKISNEDLDILLNMKQSFAERVEKIVKDLHEAKLDNYNSFKIALKRVTEKLPPVKEASIKKISKNDTQSPRSELIVDNTTKLYPETDKKNKMSGGVGIVKKAYRSSTAAEPTTIIKKLSSTHIKKGRNIEWDKEAQREVKMNRMLGRESEYYYKNDQVYIAAKFVEGKEVLALTTKELEQTPIRKRIQCLVTGLSELNVFHSHYRVHGDVGGRNYMVDLNNGVMKLIDFGSSHNMGASKIFPTATHYNDPYDLMNGVYRDLYATGIVIAQLFPDIYFVSMGYDGTKMNVIQNAKRTILEKAIVDLVNSLMNPERTLRCTSLDALNYCSQLLNNADNLNEEKLQKIASETINRSTTTVEDVIRGVKRSIPGNAEDIIVENKTEFVLEIAEKKPKDTLSELKKLISDKENNNVVVDVSNEQELLDKFVVEAKTTWVFNEFLKNFKPESQVKLLEMLGQDRLIKNISDSFNLREKMKELSSEAQLYLINMLGKKYLQEIITYSGSFVDLLCVLKQEGRSIILQEFGRENIAKLFFSPESFASKVKELQVGNKIVAEELLKFLGNEQFLLLGKNEKQENSYHRFPPIQSFYDKTSWNTFFDELDKLMQSGHNNVLLISSGNAKSEKINVSYDSIEKCWTVSFPHLVPPSIFTSKYTYQVSDKIFSTFGSSNLIELSTEFCCKENYVNENIPIVKKMEEEQTLNVFSKLPLDKLDEVKPLVMQQAFDKSNQDLCNQLIEKGVDFYLCKIVPKEANFELFNKLCEAQAKFNIENFTRDIFLKDWQIKIGGKTITYFNYGDAKVPTTVSREWNEAKKAKNNEQSYYSAWTKIIELRKEAKKYNEQRMFRSEPAKKHYRDVEQESVVLPLRSLK